MSVSGERGRKGAASTAGVVVYKRHLGCNGVKMQGEYICFHG